MRGAAATCVLLVVGVAALAGQNASFPIWQGVYTTAQAERGKTVFQARCAVCHGPALTGGAEAPALTGRDFGRNWSSRYLDRLYRKVKDRMPPGEVSTVSDREKLDIVAHLLRMNGFPAGTEELPLDPAHLATIQIVGKSGPEQSPNGALVEVIGCLTADGDAWKLTHATEPVPSTLDDPDVDGVSAAARPLGTGTVRLLDVFPSPDASQGRKMLVKGLLIRTSQTVRLNVLDLREAAKGCAP